MEIQAEEITTRDDQQGDDDELPGDTGTRLDTLFLGVAQAGRGLKVDTLRRIGKRLTNGKTEKREN